MTKLNLNGTPESSGKTDIHKVLLDIIEIYTPKDVTTPEERAEFFQIVMAFLYMAATYSRAHLTPQQFVSQAAMAYERSVATGQSLWQDEEKQIIQDN